MAGHSRLKDGVASLADVPGMTVKVISTTVINDGV
jgi:hypothetical protein